MGRNFSRNWFNCRLFNKNSGLFGLVMNFSYMFSGSIGVNPEMVILSMFVLVSGMNAGKFGMDGFVIPKVLGSKLQNAKSKLLNIENGYLILRYPFMLFFNFNRIVLKEIFYIPDKFLWFLAKWCMITFSIICKVLFLRIDDTFLLLSRKRYYHFCPI